MDRLGLMEPEMWISSGRGDMVEGVSEGINSWDWAFGGWC